MKRPTLKLKTPPKHPPLPKIPLSRALGDEIRAAFKPEGDKP
jgi:hypothetical protein